ncbi:uncharacterized protein PgNI_03398 [Pyricularia grisea]|uniref:Uncharacterized protein n=1 Tax=Pyricularia grisea TaxID=148305 RepID=A0A6P8BB05_PYRGI|nr:uncharacterized protein PgNI_03398 [Pyricularia grisea]TLD12882.1 hypothetical protein PgNI_03398 [Pyricularia grisea]
MLAARWQFGPSKKPAKWFDPSFVICLSAAESGDMTPPAENQPVKAVRKRKQHSDRSPNFASCTPSERKRGFAGLMGLLG